MLDRDSVQASLGVAPTDGAVRVFELAGAIAGSYGRSQVDTAELFVGYLTHETEQEETGPLEENGISLDRTTRLYEKWLTGPKDSSSPQIVDPLNFTNRGKEAIDLAIDEMRRRGADQLRPSDLALGVLRTTTGRGNILLAALRIDPVKPQEGSYRRVLADLSRKGR